MTKRLGTTTLNPARPESRSPGLFGLVALLSLGLVGGLAAMGSYAQSSALHREAVQAHLEQREMILGRLTLETELHRSERAELNARLADAQLSRLRYEDEVERSQQRASALATEAAEPTPAQKTTRKSTSKKSTTKKTASKKSTTKGTTESTSAPASGAWERPNKIVLDGGDDPLSGL